MIVSFRVQKLRNTEDVFTRKLSPNAMCLEGWVPTSTCWQSWAKYRAHTGRDSGSGSVWKARLSA